MRAVLIVASVLVLIACGHTPPVSQPSPQQSVDEALTPSPRPKQPFVEPERATPLEALLKQQYESWRGVPYRLGGMSRAGVDCSGFVQLTFKNKLGIKIPRSTEAQSKIGIPVDRRELETGDLVFFKTSWKKGHVGIYLNNGFFLHASTSRGVMISNLENPYWRRAYWMSRRIDLSRHR